MNLVSRTCLQKLPKLTSIAIIDGALPIETPLLFNFLKLFPNLRSLKLDAFENARYEFDEEELGFVRKENDQTKNEEVPEEEKLVIPELSIGRGDFWRIFSIDRLEKLSVSSSMLDSDEDVATFCGVIERCQRLEQLEVEIFAKDSTFSPPLLRLPEVLPQLKQFNLNMWDATMEKVVNLARQYPSIGKYAKRLEIHLSEPTGDLIALLSLKLGWLKSRCSANV